MSKPNYPEKHKAGSCNDGWCNLCEETFLHDCIGDPNAPCKACEDEVEREQESQVDQAIIEQKEKEGK